MKTLNKEIKDSVLNVTIGVGAEEFDRARQNAYMDNTDKYVVPGVAGGLADLQQLQKTYGPAVLYDEALAELIPESFNECLEENALRIMGKPQVTDITFPEDGGVHYQIKAELYPDVELGQYRGIEAPYAKGTQEFQDYVIKYACLQMKGEVPKHMIEYKLDAVTAQEKLHVINDAIYHVLADTVAILKDAYAAAGLSRPLPQVRAEAMDVMLQTVSNDNVPSVSDIKISSEFFTNQIRSLVSRYRPLPADFDESLNQAIMTRKKRKSEMKPEELTEDIFKAYLGSLELTEKQWRNERKEEAAQDVCRDLLFDAVAHKENLSVSDEEVDAAILSIADQYGMEAEDVRDKVDADALRGKLLRDKAMALVLDSAVEKIQ